MSNKAVKCCFKICSRRPIVSSNMYKAEAREAAQAVRAPFFQTALIDAIMADFFA